MYALGSSPEVRLRYVPLTSCLLVLSKFELQDVHTKPPNYLGIRAVFPNEGDPDDCRKYYQQFDKQKLPTYLVTYFDHLFLWREFWEQEVHLARQIRRLRLESCKRRCKGVVGEPTSQHTRRPVLFTATPHLNCFNNPIIG